MSSAPPMLAFDLEGVFLPEIWIAVAERTGCPNCAAPRATNPIMTS